MRKLILGFAINCAVLMAVMPALAQNSNGTPYGKTFTVAHPGKPEELRAQMGGKSSMNVQLEGTISQVCQAEGCWMKLKNTAGEDVFIKFKDHSFVIPKDLAGKTAVVNGTAIKKTVSVAEQKHMLEDAGAAKEKIEAVTTDKEELRVEATGIVVK
ncbi:DUF4920 domain-containing protein [Chitinophagaceae bacterium MMS25-I14]